MAIARALGKPALFITFTANPRWREILENLFPGQVANDRPELIARVFKMKLDELLDDLKRKHIFGRYTGIVHVIEWQKRGLPHAHILLFLDPRDLPQTPETVDQVVSAQIPRDDHALAGILKEVLTHGPCGEGFRAPCMDKEGKCSKGYPKPFCERTIVNETSYPQYQRPNNGVTWASRDGQFQFDNRWVVPHNAYLTKKFKADINVEVAGSIYCIKYLAKYVYKGTDRATLSVETRRDEIAQTVGGRYIGPSMASWRLLRFPIHSEKPAVMQLDYHLEGRHRVAFSTVLSPAAFQAAVDSQSSMFLDWFQYNGDFTDGRNQLYTDFPLTHSWTKKRGWKLRKNSGGTVGRMYVANVHQGEHFWLRWLLCVRRGPTSYVDLYTVNGVPYPTPSEACRALGLGGDDTEWVHMFEELIDNTSASSLRQTLAAALAAAVINSPQDLWNKFKASFSDDCPWRLQHDNLSSRPDDMDDNEAAVDYGLWLLGENLREFALSFEDVRLQAPRHIWQRQERNGLLAEALAYDIVDEMEALGDRVPQLNDGQRRAYENITSAVESHPASAHFFLQGPAGTGKTHLYKTLCNHYRSRGEVVICVASSGIAALLLPGGTTSHSRFKIPIEIDCSSRCGFRKNSQLGDLLRRTRLVIWDEVPLQHKHCFTAVDNSLRDAMGNDDALFGGVPFLLGGDFAQILPVVKRARREQIVEACISRWSEWPRLTKLFLTQNMRVRHGTINQEFAGWLAELSYRDSLYGPVQLPDYINVVKDRDVFINRIYPIESVQRADSEFFRSRAILCSRNDSAQEINSVVMETVPSEPQEYVACDTAEDVESGSNDQISAEFLQSISTSGLPPGRMILKVGTPVMLLRNYYPKLGLCNGTRLIITRLYNHCIKGRIISEDARFNDREHVISRIQVTTKEDLWFTLRRKQLPLKPCFAMTINKSQGQTLQYVGADLSNPVFSHGQLYVALSRVTEVNNMVVLLPERGAGRTTQNVVYPEVLMRPPADDEYGLDGLLADGDDGLDALLAG